MKLRKMILSQLEEKILDASFAKKQYALTSVKYENLGDMTELENF